MKHLKFTTSLKFFSSILDFISQNFSSKPSVSFNKYWNFQKHPLCQFYFTIEEIGSEAGPSLKCVRLSSKLVNKFETQHMQSTDIFASSLKILHDNLNPVTS